MFSTFVGLGRFINCQRPDIITSYVLKRNRKQANKKESRALFLFGRAGPVGR